MKIRFRISFFIFCFILTSLSSQITKRDSIKQQVENLKKTLPNFQKDTLYINTLLDLAFENRYYNLDTLYLLTNEALGLSESIDFKIGKAKCYFNLGTFFSKKGKHELALKNFSISNNQAKEHAEYELELTTIDAIAYEYEFKGNFTLALKTYLEGKERAESLKNFTSLANFNANIASLYLQLNDYDMALNYYTKAKIIRVKLGKPIALAKTNCNIAHLNIDLKKFDIALKNLDYSLKIFKENAILDWLAYAYEIKGKLFLKKNEFETAVLWYQKSEAIYKELDDEYYQIRMLLGMSEALLGLNKNELSFKYANKARKLSEKLTFTKGSKDSARMLFLINKSNGEFETALKYYEKYQTLKDSLSIKENNKALMLFKAQKEYEEEKEEFIEANEELVAKQKSYVFISIGILIFLLTVLFLVKRNEKNYKSLNQKLMIQQANLKQSEKQLRYTNLTKNKLFSIVGHDLRGPIISFQELIKLHLKGSISKKEFIAFVPKLKTYIDSIAFTLDNLLHWGQTQINGLTTNPTNNIVQNILDDNISLLSEIASKKSISIQNNISSNIVSFADGNHLDVVVRNLLNNALKFTEENGEISIGAADRLNFWEIYIKDTGIGMDKKTIDEIFNTDKTYSTVGTNKEKGTGLGISLCKELIELNGGKIWVESSLNIGSSFFFTLPKSELISK